MEKSAASLHNSKANFSQPIKCVISRPIRSRAISSKWILLKAVETNQPFKTSNLFFQSWPVPKKRAGKPSGGKAARTVSS